MCARARAPQERARRCYPGLVRHILLTFIALLLAASCQNAPATDASTTGSDDHGTNACLQPLPGMVFPPPLNPQSTCCNGETCRGSCNELLTGNGEERVAQCVCGRVTFDGEAHHGPPGCAADEECCAALIGDNRCVPKGKCFDCAPPKSSKFAVALCCLPAITCRGHCSVDGGGPCSCEAEGDGGCVSGFECCVDPNTQARTCVPFGECNFDLGPCPPQASPGISVDCCNTDPCRGRCEGITEGPAICRCGSSPGCKADEECCLAPSGQNLDPETHCVPAGTCAQGN